MIMFNFGNILSSFISDFDTIKYLNTLSGKCRDSILGPINPFGKPNFEILPVLALHITVATAIGVIAERFCGKQPYVDKELVSIFGLSIEECVVFYNLFATWLNLGVGWYILIFAANLGLKKVMDREYIPVNPINDLTDLGKPAILKKIIVGNSAALLVNFFYSKTTLSEWSTSYFGYARNALYRTLVSHGMFYEAVGTLAILVGYEHARDYEAINEEFCLEPILEIGVRALGVPYTGAFYHPAAALAKNYSILDLPDLIMVYFIGPILGRHLYIHIYNPYFKENVPFIGQKAKNR